MRNTISRMWLLFSLLATASLSLALVVGLKKVMIVTWDDSSCTGIGGKIIGHSQVIATTDEGDLFEATVTQCEVTVKSKPKPKAVASNVPAEMPNLTTFSAIMEISGLSGEVDSAKNLTILAPTDDAFAKLPKRQVEQLTTNRAAAAAFITRHLVAENRIGLDARSSMKATSSAKSRDGVERRIEIKPGKMTFGGVRVFAMEIPTGNGVMLMLDAIIEEKR